jgi:AraC-like DNA-binding protein
MKQRTYNHFFNSPSKLTRDNLFYIESIGHYWCDKSFFEDSYYRQNYYLIYIISGKGYIYSQKERVLVTSGQLLFINLNEPYKFYSHKKDPWEILWILFGGCNTDWFYQSISNKSPIIHNIKSTSIIPELLEAIFDLFDKKDIFVDVKSSRLLTDILTEFYIESKSQYNSSRNMDLIYPNPVATIISYVEQNYFRKISLNELSSITFLSQYYLLRLFKKHTGNTPGEYINNYRLNLGKKLLLEPELNIEQIALSVGFYTHSYFSKMFKKSTGVTPEQFRKQYLP